MGGLKDELPITYWTFLDRRAGDCRRAAASPASSARTRSCSETFASGHTLLWVVGLLTSLLTAIYMFRLVFLAFHGERRAAATAAHLVDRGTTRRTGHDLPARDSSARRAAGRWRSR